MRVGLGYDVHRFATDGDQVPLCGVKIPHNKGVIAHSDGDVALHALCDALLGALALGDIGQHFPDTDPRYHNCPSLELLRQVMQLVDQAGYQLGNLDLMILAERPKISPYLAEMRQTLSQVLQAPIGAISIKATTSERLGFIGREEGLAAHAVVCLTLKS